MQTSNRILDDLARVATGAAGTFAGLRQEMEARLRERLESALRDMDLVTREEFEVVQAMAAKARTEQAALSEQVAALQAQLAALAAAALPGTGSPETEPTAEGSGQAGPPAAIRPGQDG
jgi:BMFP domain-containing protein YqiC